MSTSVTPFFLDGSQGKLFCLHFLSNSSNIKGHVLYFPPFGEEMNRCRALAAALARRLAALDYSCLIMDLYGTGDSEGELIDASWQTWREDSLMAVNWLKDYSDAPISALGLRLGALLSLDMANTHQGMFDQVILWQPIINGENYLTQIFRQRVAYLVDNKLPAETTQEIRQRLFAGDTLEISGYVFSGSLAASIDKIKLRELSNLTNLKINWFEHVSDPDKPVTIASKKAIDQLIEQNNIVNVHTFTSPPLWELHKRDDATELLELTAKLYS